MLPSKTLRLFSVLLGMSAAMAHAQSVKTVTTSKPLKPYTNSLGMKMTGIQQGVFNMGAENAKFQLGKVTVLSKDAPYYDETPVHSVSITHPFYISETEVTIDQFRQFKKEYKGSTGFSPYAAGISWNDAMAFCNWLSKKEGKTYRLPTEAEWEFACRAGSQTLFWSGDALPKEDVNPWGLKNMHSGVAEWCYDWYGEYPEGSQTDPVGFASGWAKVIRGGAAHTTELEDNSPDFHPITDAVFYRAANRASMQPDCPAAGSDQMAPHYVGFRIVQGALPATQAMPFSASGPMLGVKQSTHQFAQWGPDVKQPYFKARQVMASPPDLTYPWENETVGLHPANQGKVHSSGFVACPNGDLLLIGFSSSRIKSEAAPNTTMVVTRLRNGAERWEMPELFYDRSGLNDQSALLWNDNGTLWFFGGGRGLGHIPFVFSKSTDNGATWSPLQTPVIKGTVDPFAPQPINSAFRAADNTIYFGSDAIGASSFLWASKDNGKTWFDTKGRTRGRHTTFVMLKDNRILAMGGKNSNIEGFMPQCFSGDNGKTWSENTRSPFAALGSNQRPVIMRLQSGRLFFAGDYQDIRMLDNPPPKSITDRGAYVALSDDEGKTWKIKRLYMAPEHNDWHGIVKKGGKPQHGFGTLGYCAAAQSPNGLIHLMTSKGKPSMHFALNEAWILSDFTGEVNQLPGKSDGNIQTIEEKYANGKPRVVSAGYHGKTGFVLHGKEVWYYENGAKQYEATYNNGLPEGKENFWSADGNINWTRDNTPYGTSIWTHYWPDGKKRSESTWWGLTATGPAISWDRNGKVLHQVLFENGRRVITENKTEIQE